MSMVAERRASARAPPGGPAAPAAGASPLGRWPARGRAPGKLNRSGCDFGTLVWEGELRFRRPGGAFKEARPTWSCVQGFANGEPHSEGAGDQTAILPFSFRRADGAMILNPDGARNVTFWLGLANFA